MEDKNQWLVRIYYNASAIVINIKVCRLRWLRYMEMMGHEQVRKKSGKYEARWELYCLPETAMAGQRRARPA